MSDVKPFVLDFDLVSGFCTSGKVKPTQRRVSDMVAQFANEAAARAMVEGGDPLLYEFYGLDLPEDDSGVLQFGTTILYPGKVGEEYFMTKGAASITIVTLLDKPSRRTKAITADLAGFTVPDEFVVGYGLDYCQQYRNVPYIGVLKPEVYENH